MWRNQAAEQARVHQVTVSNWVQGRPGFQAELNRRRVELIEQRAKRLREISVFDDPPMLTLVVGAS